MNRSGDESANEANSADQEESAGFFQALRQQLISVRTMSRPLQVVVVIAFAQLGIVALLLATQGLPQPQIPAGISSNLPAAHLPLGAFVVIALSLALGWCFILTGALRVHWGLRLPVIALVTVALGYYPVVQLYSDNGLTGEPFVTEVRLAWVQLGVLGLFWVWSAGLLLINRHPPNGIGNTGGQQHSPSFPVRSFWLVCALLLIYEGAALGVWLAYQRAGIPSSVGVFADALTGQVFVLPLLLAVVIYWSSTDFIEWGEVGVHALLSIMRRVERRRTNRANRANRPWLLMAVTGVVATGIVIDVLRVYQAGAIFALWIASLIAQVLVLLAYLARIDAHWPERVPTAALLAGVAFMFGEFVLVYPLGDLFVSWWGMPVASAGSILGVMFGVLVNVLSLTIGAVLLARGRLLHQRVAGITGLFLIVATFLVIVGNAHLVLATIGLGMLNPPFHLLAGFRLLAALCTLGLIGWLSIQPQPRWHIRRLLAMILLLLAGLQMIEWSFDVVAVQTAFGKLSAVAFAAVFLVAVFWDVLTSGEEITNGNSLAFPRDGRVLLYLGYTIVASSVLLYAASVQVLISGALSADALSTDNDAGLGILILGLPLVGLSLALRLGRWLALQRSAARHGPSSIVPSRPSHPVAALHTAGRVQAAIIGSGMSVMLVILVLTIFWAVPLAEGSARNVPTLTPSPNAKSLPTPPTVSPSPQAPYRASIPGPGCDGGGGHWTLVPPDAETQCEAAWTQVALSANASVVLQFVPPEQPIASNYQVAAQVGMGSLSSGCAGLITRASAKGFYEVDICTDGRWFVFVNTSSAQLIGQGTTLPATSYTLSVDMRGNNLTVSINGVTMPAVSDTTLVTSDFIGVSLNNLGDSAGTASVSDFTYQPLP
jgi:hypothetical protein